MTQKKYGEIDINMENITEHVTQLHEDVKTLALANMRKDIAIAELTERLDNVQGIERPMRQPY